MKKTLVIKLDVSKLTATQIDALTAHLEAQAEGSDDHPEKKMRYPEVPILSTETITEHTNGIKSTQNARVTKFNADLTNLINLATNLGEANNEGDLDRLTDNFAKNWSPL